MTCPDIYIVPPQDKFLALSLETNTNALASYLPGGELYRAKNIKNSNFRNYLSGIAIELIRVESKIKELADDYYIWTTEDLIGEWESAVGIPDSCYSNDGDLDLRRKQVIAKLALSNTQTRQDWICFAAFFGYTINIYSGEIFGGFPARFPVLLAQNEKEARFTIVVEFIGLIPPANSVFPGEFPMLLGGDETSFLRCVFTKMKPAQCAITFIYN